MIAAGRLKHWIAILRNDPTKDDAGDLQDSWSTVLERSAEVMPLTGRKLTEARQISEEVTHQVTMRYEPDVKAGIMRVEYDGRILEIENVINVNEANEDLLLMCKERI